MSLDDPTIPPQVPISLADRKKTDLRTQFAALCYRTRKGKPEILLVTSRTRKRWILPKGWPMDGRTPAQAAAREAFEEAGVKGKSIEANLGLYFYLKPTSNTQELPCVAVVYPVKVKKLLKHYPESAQRKRKWFTPKKAASKVEEPELAYLLASFDPRKLRVSN